MIKHIINIQYTRKIHFVKNYFNTIIKILLNAYVYFKSIYLFWGHKIFLTRKHSKEFIVNHIICIILIK